MKDLAYPTYLGKTVTQEQQCVKNLKAIIKTGVKGNQLSFQIFIEQ